MFEQSRINGIMRTASKASHRKRSAVNQIDDHTQCAFDSDATVDVAFDNSYSVHDNNNVDTEIEQFLNDYEKKDNSCYRLPYPHELKRVGFFGFFRNAFLNIFDLMCLIIKFAIGLLDLTWKAIFAVIAIVIVLFGVVSIYSVISASFKVFGFIGLFVSASAFFYYFRALYKNSDDPMAVAAISAIPIAISAAVTKLTEDHDS